MVVLEARGLGKVYRAGARDEVRALEAISLGVERGRFAVVTGPSGSGKTTLLALLGVLDRPTQGRVLLDGQDLSRCSDTALARARRRMGFVFQDLALIEQLSAEDNVTYPLIPRGWARAERRRRAQDLLGRLGLSAKCAARAGDLSGGEQQRVALARALAGRPDVVLADEPTAHLDVDTSRALLAILRELTDGGAAVVVAAHDPGVLALADCRYQLEGGRLRPPTPPQPPDGAAPAASPGAPS